MFHEVVGSSHGLNLKGQAKADFLRARHPAGFAYVGNSAADLPVWRAAAERFAVNLSPSVRRCAAREGMSLVELAHAEPVLRALLKSMRLHQWLKNLLVLVPLALMARRAWVSDVIAFPSGFLLFGLLTSGTYLINDILDIESDRKHPRKRQRPIASGDLPLPVATIAAIGLILVAVAGSIFSQRTLRAVCLGLPRPLARLFLRLETRATYRCARDRDPLHFAHRSRYGARGRIAFGVAANVLCVLLFQPGADETRAKALNGEMAGPRLAR